MNRRQAKIEALTIIVATVQQMDWLAMELPEMSEQDLERVEREFRLIQQQLEMRLERLQQPKDEWQEWLKATE